MTGREHAPFAAQMSVVAAQRGVFEHQQGPEGKDVVKAKEKHAQLAAQVRQQAEAARQEVHMHAALLAWGLRE